MAYDVEALIKRHTADCMKLMHGKCSTRACLVRGGYVGPGPVDYSVATCEARETIEALRAGHPTVTVSAEEKPDRLEVALEDFQRTMSWSSKRTGLEKALVLGNLRGFASFLRERGFASLGGRLPIETAPKNGTPIIYFDARGCVGAAFWQDKDEHEPAWWDEANAEEVEPTHWLPHPRDCVS